MNKNIITLGWGTHRLYTELLVHKSEIINMRLLRHSMYYVILNPTNSVYLYPKDFVEEWGI